MGLAVSTCPPEPAPQIALLGCDWGLDGSGGSGVCPQGLGDGMGQLWGSFEQTLVFICRKEMRDAAGRGVLLLPPEFQRTSELK